MAHQQNLSCRDKDHCPHPQQMVIEHIPFITPCIVTCRLIIRCGLYMDKRTKSCQHLGVRLILGAAYNREITVLSFFTFSPNFEKKEKLFFNFTVYFLVLLSKYLLKQLNHKIFAWSRLQQFSKPHFSSNADPSLPYQCKFSTFVQVGKTLQTNGLFLCFDLFERI